MSVESGDFFGEATEAVDPAAERARHRVGETLRGEWRLDVLLGVGGMAAACAANRTSYNNGALQ